MKFEMLDLFLIAMLMVAIFFGLAMLSLHGIGYMTWLSWTMLGAVHGAYLWLGNCSIQFGES